uniref:Uncharacterized protein n=1 Tax=Leersia perrieri TaxID=77586 RepID=A0A0D9X8P0_9ORYZ
MGTFLGHFVPGLAFAILGMWHVLNTVKSYKLKGASGFRAATWFPFPSPLRWLKHLELYLLLAFSVLAIADQLVNLPLLSFSVHPDALEHATMYLHLAVYASVALAAAAADADAQIGDVVAALAASVFGQELFLLRFHSADHKGIEGHYHWLLQIVVAASVVTTSATVIVPRSFAVAVVRSASVLFQGLWFVVMGFALWVPALVPKGCHGVGDGGDGGGDAMRSAVACATEEAARRAVVMANLQFSWVLAVVWAVTAYLCIRVESSRCTEYRQIQAPGGIDAGAIAGVDDGDAAQKRVFPVSDNVLFLLRPSSYVAPVWFPVRRARYLELVLIIAGAAASILMELIIGPARHNPFDADGTVPSDHLHNFEHASISLSLLVYAALAIALDRTAPRATRRDAAAVSQLAAFEQELVIFRLHSADHDGVEGQYHLLLQGVLAVTLVATVAGVAAPGSVEVSVVRSASLVFQGVWFVAMGVMLWTPAFLPKGCFLSQEDGHDVAQCRAGAPLARAKALVNLEFSWFLSATVVLVVAIYIRMCRIYKEEPRYVPLVTGDGRDDDGDGDDSDVEAGKGGGSGHVLLKPMEIARP